MDRIRAANKGYGLDILINDSDELVRVAVAHQGYGLKTLIHDKEAVVRAEVAYQGYNLDTLAKDKDEMVRAIAIEKRYDEAMQQLRNGTMKKQDKFRCIANNIGLDILAKDKDMYVRSEIAEQGKYLDILALDDEPHVRACVAKNHAHFDTLSKDEDELVRGTVALFCKTDGSDEKYIEQLLKDKSPYVRTCLAQKGIGLDRLENDEDWYVRHAVSNYRKHH